MTTKSKTYSAFEEWFEAQFGKDPDCPPIWELRDALKNHEGMVVALRESIVKLNERSEQRRAALYAWNARAFSDAGVPLVKK